MEAASSSTASDRNMHPNSNPNSNPSHELWPMTLAYEVTNLT